ncbi:ribonuclease H-like domain-containing protein [Tanacetum coccineum]
MPRVKSVRRSGVIIKDWVSDDDEDIFQSEDSQTTVKPSFKKIKFTKANNEIVKSDKQAVKPRMVTQSPKVDRIDWNGKMTQKLRSGRIPVSTAKQYVNTATPKNRGNLQQALKYKGMFNSGCSRHMTGNKALLTDYHDIDGGFVAFGRSTRCGKITVLLRVPRKNNMYKFDLKNVVPSGDLTFLFAKPTINEYKLWHRRLGHVDFKTMNKLAKGNLACFLHALRFDFELCHCLYRLCHLRSLILETTCSYFCFILKASNSELAEVFVLILELHDRNVL